MFKNLRTSTKLLILCSTFLVSIGVTIYGLATEKQIAIDFARKELVGSRYLSIIRTVYAEILAPRSRDGSIEQPARLTDLAQVESEIGGRLQTADLAQALAVALGELRSRQVEDGRAGVLVLDALSKAQALAARVGDDSNLTLDPDLDTYYVQSIVVRKLPAFLGRLSELQDFFQTSVEAGSPSLGREVRVPILASLLQSTAREVKSDIEAAYRGNADGNLKGAVDAEISALMLSSSSYLEVLSVSTLGVDARDAVAYNQLHESAVRQAIKVWTVLQAELDRLLLQRIANLLERMVLGLGLIGALGGISLAIAVLTSRHIVRPLQRLEAVASTVRETKDYSLRAELCSSQDEIGRVTAAFNDMLSELAAARMRETVERAELARVSRLTTIGEMAASIAHEVKQPLAAIVASGNAALRWLANTTPDLGKAHAALQRIVSDGHRASRVIDSVGAMFKKDTQQKAAVDVNGLIEEVLAALHSELQSERISVQVERDERARHVLANRVQLQQVLLNLIVNAIDGMRSIGDRPRVLRVGVGVSESNSVLVRVDDTGSGIDPELRDRIFEPFVTTKPGGMGLGLSICRSIVEAHGGRVSVSAGNPHGSSFQLALPPWKPSEA
jgi:signal transduction histidine kinase